MNNLWRIITLFVLPGMVVGGNTIAAFFRLTDGGLEPLMALAFAGVIWCSTAYIVSQISYWSKKSASLYYPAMALTALLFTLAVGSAVLVWGNGTISATVGITVSAAATALVIHSFTAKSYSVFDRLSFMLGAFIGAFIWLYAALFSRLSWMETLFYYLAAALLLAWAFASPLTCRGSRRRRWQWRILLIAGAIASFYTVPTFSPPPTVKITDKLWTKTYTTVNGRRFILTEKSGRFALYTPNGKLLMPDKADENAQAALLVMMSFQKKTAPKILLAAPLSSTIPQQLKSFPSARLKFYRLPEAMQSKRFNIKNPDFSRLIPRLNNNYHCDILLMTALPENPYPVFLKKSLQTLTATLQPNGMAAIPGNLLKNPTVFSYMHENFAFSGALPVPGDWWVFSRNKLELSPQYISKNLQDTFYDSLGNSADMFEVLYFNRNLWGKSPALPTLPQVHYGSNKILGSWWWCFFGIAAAVLWRIIRLFGERRNIMYGWFNAVENGFSGMGTFLLIMAILLLHNGATLLLLMALSISIVLFNGKWSAGGVWCSLAGLLLLGIMLGVDYSNTIILALIMVQSVLLTGTVPALTSDNVHQQQQMLSGVFLGLLLASLALAAVWFFNIPLLVIWCLIFAARVPGIWQYARKSVYYRNR